MDKKDLRNIYRKKRDMLTSEQIKSLSRTISEAFFKTDEYILSEWIFTYVGIKSEVLTTEIIKKAFLDEKKIAVPVMTGKKHEMVFIQIRSMDELKENKYGIPEPPFCEENLVIPNEKTVIIVPGLCFSCDMHRLGYGGGFYDKYLSEHMSMKNVGFAYDFQIVEKIPYEETDIKIDKIITENRII